MFQEAKDEVRELVERKIQDRKKTIEKGLQGEKKLLQNVDKIKSEPLIMTVDELNRTVTSITSLSVLKSSGC